MVHLKQIFSFQIKCDTDQGFPHLCVVLTHLCTSVVVLEMLRTSNCVCMVVCSWSHWAELFKRLHSLHNEYMEEWHCWMQNILLLMSLLKKNNVKENKGQTSTRDSGDMAFIPSSTSYPLYDLGQVTSCLCASVLSVLFLGRDCILLDVHTVPNTMGPRSELWPLGATAI